MENEMRVRKRRKMLTDIEKAEIARMYADESIPLRDIMKKFDVSKAVISVIGHKAGMQRKRFFTEAEIDLIRKAKELGCDAVAEQISMESGIETTAETVRSLYYFYQNKDNGSANED